MTARGPDLTRVKFLEHRGGVMRRVSDFAPPFEAALDIATLSRSNGGEHGVYRLTMKPGVIMVSAVTAIGTIVFYYRAPERSMYYLALYLHRGEWHAEIVTRDLILDEADDVPEEFFWSDATYSDVDYSRMPGNRTFVV